MSLFSPKPIIARVHRTWRVSPGFTFALVEDLEKALWIVESCPAGTHCWTLAQAAELKLGSRTHGPLSEAVREGRHIEQSRQAPLLSIPPVASAPAKPASMESRSRSLRRQEITKTASGSRSTVRAARPGKTLVGV